MKIVAQKTHSCKLYVGEKLISEIGSGLILFVGVHRDDSMENVKYLAHKLCNMRLFKDENGKINKSVLDMNGDVMVVSNFTLNAEISSGTRPSFSNSAPPDIANTLYLALADEIHKEGIHHVATGAFGEHMHLDTTLDGPFNIVIER